MIDNPITRKEKYLAKLTGSYTGNVPDPITRVEKYLYDLCQKGISGLTPEEIENAVNKYLKENPVQPGATEEQAQQIKKNTDDVASLKESISTKITKFYASSQGETHIADSDDGKIMDMMVYGKSEQKQYSGKNLLNATLQTTTQNGVTCTANGDGTYILDGTANANAVFNLGSVTFTGDTKYKICGCPQGGGIIERYHIEPYGSTNEQRDIGNGVIYSLSNDETKAIYIVVTIGFRASNLLFKPMLTTDMSATYDDFEPYTGGIPSPNPDYPQEIKSVVNPTVKVCGKNLLNYKETTINNPDVAGIEFVENGFRIYTKKDINYCSSKTYLDFSKLRIGETYTLSANLLIVKGVSRLTIRNRLHTIIADSSNITESGTYKISFTLTDKMHYVSFFATFDAAVSGDVIVTNIQLEKGSTPTAYEPYHEQTVTLPYTLNAIPVLAGGNVTIDGQQYIADYVDVERGKLVRMCKEKVFDGTENWRSEQSYMIAEISNFNHVVNNDYMTYLICNKYKVSTNTGNDDNIIFARENGDGVVIKDTLHQTTVDDWKKYLNDNQCIVCYLLAIIEEIDLTTEEITAFKALATYYPTTNISINSEQLDGYTIFNYPISMENGWNYVKKQLNDNRDYIYDMDLQSAEAYVNSEYAVALTELEV